MRIVTLIALVFLAAPFVRVATQGTETRLSHWPNGGIRSQIEVRRNLQGRLDRHGRAQVFHENGAPSSVGGFRDDVQHGRWMWYSPEGQLIAVCEYENGIGPYRALFPDGRVLREGTMDGDDRVGRWREYYPSGRIKLEGEYVGGLQHGIWTAWSDEESPQKRSVRFEHGEMVERD